MMSPRQRRKRRGSKSPRSKELRMRKTNPRRRK
jgi:hypothetical protein